MPVHRILSAAIALLLLPIAAASQTATPNRPSPPAVPDDRPTTDVPGRRLPVRRVVLYKGGVGYFEHLGRIRGNQTVSIDLTSGQLDDVLKSLTTLDMSGGQVTGIAFNSAAPIEQRLRTLGIGSASTSLRMPLAR